jgi:tetratricopeptide (TPR) repeat protein
MIDDFELNLEYTVERTYDVTDRLNKDTFVYSVWAVVILLLAPTCYAYFKIIEEYILNNSLSSSISILVLIRLLAPIAIFPISSDKNYDRIPFVILTLFFPVISFAVLYNKKKRLFPKSYDSYSYSEKQKFLYEHSHELLKVNKWLDSLYFCNEALKVETGDLYMKESILNLKALIYMKLCHFDKAAEFYTKAIEVNNDCWEYYFNRGDALFKAKDYEGAKKDWEFTLNLRKDNFIDKKDIEEKLDLLSSIQFHFNLE